MWVYIYQNNSELAMQNAYIGEVYEYSYTFKWKTAAQIWNEWTTQVWQIYTDSNWATGANGVEMVITKNIPSISEARKIIIKYTSVINVNTRWACTIWITRWTWWGTGSAWWEVEWSQYNWLWVIFYDWAEYHWNIVWYASVWTYNPTIIIDLENKSITQEISWYNNSVFTLTDSQISTLRQFYQLSVYTSQNSSTISDISIIIE